MGNDLSISHNFFHEQMFFYPLSGTFCRWLMWKKNSVVFFWYTEHVVGRARKNWVVNFFQKFQQTCINCEFPRGT